MSALLAGCDAQAKMQTVNRSMVNIVGALEKSLAGNNLERMAEVQRYSNSFGVRSMPSRGRQIVGLF